MKKMSLADENVKYLLKQLSLVLIGMTICRIVFYAFNAESFPNISIQDFILGIWFDCITIAYYFLPFIAISLLPKIQSLKGIQFILTSYYFLISALMFALNLMDIEYFKFTGKRSTFDLFAILGAGNDFSQLATSFITDFWFIILIWCLLLFALFKIWRKIQIKQTTFSWFKKTTWLVITVGFTVFISRGGLVLKPIGIIEASQYANPENTTLVLNTPFTMLKSYGKQGLEEKNYFSEQELDQLFNPKKKSHPQHILPKNTNVVVIMLESFGNEYVGAYNQKETYTPFFDSIIQEGWSFKYGISNGKKSIEAVPSILASMPSLMDNPYISSNYANNQINSIPSILKKFGYSSAFYHGATNGSMRFNGFSAHMGFDHYVGRFEYHNDAHFDKTWGILDEYFNPWAAKEMTKLPTPFFSTLFTLSSHHPYYVPERHRKHLKKGPHPICMSINYGDYALRKFFEEAKKQPWYTNTLFILVADHTPFSTNALYSQKRFLYQIPVVFYDPQGRLPKKMETTIFQHMDILPTVLDLLDIETPYYAFGNSYFSKEPREAITYMEGSYYYFLHEHMYIFSKDKARNLYNFSSRKNKYEDSLTYYPEEKKWASKRIQAIIQRYNHDLPLNKTTYK